MECICLGMLGLANLQVAINGADCRVDDSARVAARERVLDDILRGLRCLILKRIVLLLRVLPSPHKVRLQIRL
jgi:hypothetical protein